MQVCLIYTRDQWTGSINANSHCISEFRIGLFYQSFALMPQTVEMVFLVNDRDSIGQGFDLHLPEKERMGALFRSL